MAVGPHTSPIHTGRAVISLGLIEGRGALNQKWHKPTEIEETQAALCESIVTIKTISDQDDKLPKRYGKKL